MIWQFGAVIDVCLYKMCLAENKCSVTLFSMNVKDASISALREREVRVFSGHNL